MYNSFRVLVVLLYLQTDSKPEAEKQCVAAEVCLRVNTCNLCALTLRVMNRKLVWMLYIALAWRCDKSGQLTLQLSEIQSSTTWKRWINQAGPLYLRSIIRHGDGSWYAEIIYFKTKLPCRCSGLATSFSSPCVFFFCRKAMCYSLQIWRFCTFAMLKERHLLQISFGSIWRNLFSVIRTGNGSPFFKTLAIFRHFK